MTGPVTHAGHTDQLPASTGCRGTSRRWTPGRGAASHAVHVDWLAEQIEAHDTNPALLAVYQAERASDADHAAGAISVGLDPSLPGYVPWSSGPSGPAARRPADNHDRLIEEGAELRLPIGILLLPRYRFHRADGFACYAADCTRVSALASAFAVFIPCLQQRACPRMEGWPTCSVVAAGGAAQLRVVDRRHTRGPLRWRWCCLCPPARRCCSRRCL